MQSARRCGFHIMATDWVCAGELIIIKNQDELASEDGIPTNEEITAVINHSMQRYLEFFCKLKKNYC